jgi:hypothetical protein
MSRIGVSRLRAALATVVLSSAAAPAVATVPVALAEPDTFALLAASAVAALVVWVRKRRK